MQTVRLTSGGNTVIEWSCPNKWFKNKASDGLKKSFFEMATAIVRLTVVNLN